MTIKMIKVSNKKSELAESIYYDNCDVFTLEKITQWDNQAEWRLMKRMQKLLLGHGHL